MLRCSRRLLRIRPGGGDTCTSVLSLHHISLDVFFLFFLNILFLGRDASVLEADVVADLAGGSGAGLGQEKPPIGANAHLVDSLPGSGGGGGAGGGLSLRQSHQANPAGIQRDLVGREQERL